MRDKAYNFEVGGHRPPVLTHLHVVTARVRLAEGKAGGGGSALVNEIVSSLLARYAAARFDDPLRRDRSRRPRAELSSEASVRSDVYERASEQACKRPRRDSDTESRGTKRAAAHFGSESPTQMHRIPGVGSRNIWGDILGSAIASKISQRSGASGPRSLLWPSSRRTIHPQQRPCRKLTW